MINDSWQVSYPNGLVNYIDFFRKKYFQYEIFDKVIDNYITKHSHSNGKKIISLGSGTGTHEMQLEKLGYEVIGLERNEESVRLARNFINQCNSNVKIYKCDFLNKDDVDSVMKEVGLVDAVVLLLIPISSGDYATAANNLKDWIKPGGLFVSENFDYEEKIDINKLKIISNVEVAESPDGKDYAVRLNYYEYKNNIAKWDAIYLYYDENNQLSMKRDHDILEIIPEKEGFDCLKLDKEFFKPLPNYKVTECEEGLNPPLLYDYLIGYRKNE